MLSCPTEQFYVQTYEVVSLSSLFDAILQGNQSIIDSELQQKYETVQNINNV
jgi:hypothetical protein